MHNRLSSSAQRVQDILVRLGLDLKVLELPSSTRTAQDAAASIGCQLGQIVKSLIFKGVTSSTPILVITCGSNRVDEIKIAQHVNERVMRADADFVRECTGFAIGGIPPVGHSITPLVFIDEELLQFEDIWAAAGTPNGVFRLTPSDLCKITQGKVCCVKQS